MPGEASGGGEKEEKEIRETDTERDGPGPGLDDAATRQNGGDGGS